MGGNSKRKYTRRVNKSFCFFTKLFHPRTALERPKSSPLMWPPRTHTEKQSKLARTLLFLIVEVCNRQCFSQEARRGERQTTRKQTRFLNVWKFMSPLTAQNSCHLCEEAINIHNHKNTLRHPRQNQCHIILVYYSSSSSHWSFCFDIVWCGGR